MIRAPAKVTDGLAVLVVDDSDLTRKLLRETLEAEGCVVRAASHGGEALRILASYHPRIAVVDVQMPGMSGLELATRIKGDPATKDIFVVAASCDADLDPRLISGSGCNAFLRKPFGFEDLAGVLAEFAGGVRPRRCNPEPGAGRGLRKLEARIGRERLEEVLAMSVKETSDGLVQAQSALAAGDHRRLARTAHRICGLSALLGWEPIRTVCADLERLADAGNLESAASLIAELAAALPEEYAAIDSWKHENDPARTTAHEST